jgi:hypothetical protein
MPPALFPRSLQVARSLKALAGRGWSSTVVCAAPPPDATIDPELQDRYETSYAALRLQAPHQPSQFWERAIRRFVRAADPDAGWIAAATEAGASAAATQQFQALISFAQPWSDHAIGLRLATRTRLPWIAHFSDPWADSPFLTDATLRAQALTAERKIVETADMLVFPVDRVADLVMRKYPPRLAEKVRVVPHGFEPRARRTARRGDASTPLRLIHAGDFYGIRTPAPLIASLRRLHAGAPLDGKIEVVFIGSVPDEHRAAAHEAGLDGVVRFAGRIANAQCDSMLENADALLVMDAPAAESVFLPSKLIDYLPFELPIVGLTPASGASADLLRELGCPVAEPDDVAAIAGVVEALLAQWQAGELAAGERFHAVASRYDIAATTALLDKAIGDAVKSKVPSCVL